MVPDLYWLTCPHLSAIPLVVSFIFEGNNVGRGSCGTACGIHPAPDRKDRRQEVTVALVIFQPSEVNESDCTWCLGDINSA